MDYRQAVKQVQQGHCAPVYVCYGPEKYRMEQFVEYVSSKLIDKEHRDFAISKYDMGDSTIDEVLDDAETMPFMVPSKLVIARNAMFLTGAKESGKTKGEQNVDRLQQYLQNPFEGTVIIFMVNADKLDERKKLVKSLKAADAVIPFMQLGEEELQDWVVKQAKQNQFTLADGAVQQLILYTGGQLQALASEIEKISLYLGNERTATVETVDLLVARTAEHNVFMLIDDVVHKRLDRAFTTFHDLLKQKEEPIKIAALIARQFRIILQVKELSSQGFSQQQMAGQLGLAPYAVKLAEGQGRKYDSRQLSGLLSRLADLDFQMKSGGIDKTLGLELFLLQLAG